jgi:glycosyltransferase involved in cell wall biosynthesis
MSRILFVLPVRGGAGGAHSVVQEVGAMRDLGIEAAILVNRANVEAFRTSYAHVEWVAGGGVQAFEGPKELSQHIAGADFVAATTNTSVHSVAEALPYLRGAAPRTGYYVQDYEPLFYDPGSFEHGMAEASFGLLAGCTYFAKTNWLVGLVEAAHGERPRLVVPSIDHGLYRPAPRPRSERPLVVAMVRPLTPRRAPRRTLRVLGELAAGAFGPVDAAAFGTDAAELAEHGLALPDGVRLLGRLDQGEMGDLLRRADAFLDLSDYQAFGRTAAEAMACGCIALAPALGGAGDFIRDGETGFLADTRDPAAVAAALRRMLSLTEAERRAVRLAAIEAVSGFTPLRAAISELRVFGVLG